MGEGTNKHESLEENELSPITLLAFTCIRPTEPAIYLQGSVFICLFVYLPFLTAFFRAAGCTVVPDTQREKLWNSRTFIKYPFLSSTISMWAGHLFTWIAGKNLLFTF